MKTWSWRPRTLLVAERQPVRYRAFTLQVFEESTSQARSSTRQPESILAAVLRLPVARNAAVAATFTSSVSGSRMTPYCSRAAVIDTLSFLTSHATDAGKRSKELP